MTRAVRRASPALIEQQVTLAEALATLREAADRPVLPPGIPDLRGRPGPRRNGPPLTPGAGSASSPRWWRPPRDVHGRGEEERLR
jgi:hypothetical protein